MKKLYERIDFVNDAAPDLNAANLNRMSKGLDDVDTRLSEIIPADDYAELAEETRENAEKARIAAESAEAIVGIGIATTTKAGIVKPDGRTISVAGDGTITCINGGGGDYDATLSTTSENAPQNKAVTNALDNINVYVGSDGKIHFTDRTGADSALPFNPSIELVEFFYKTFSQTTDQTQTFSLEKGRYIVNAIRTYYTSSNTTANIRSASSYFQFSGADSVQPLHDTTCTAIIELNSAKSFSVKSLKPTTSGSQTSYFLVWIYKIG